MQNFKEKLKEISKNEYFIRYKPFILPVVSSVTCVLLLLFVIIPQSLKIKTNRKNLNDIQTKVKFYKQKTATLKQIEPQLYNDNLTAALLALPDDRDIPGIIGQVQTLLLQIGLSLDGITFSNPAASGNAVSNYQVHVQTTGGIEQIKSFISKMQESSRLVRLTQVDLTSFGASGEKIQANTEFTTFYQPLPQIATNLDQQVPELSEKDKQLLAKLKNSLSQISPLIQSQEPAGGLVSKNDPFN